jgi:predicted PurR-regulated permease PerM
MQKTIFEISWDSIFRILAVIAAVTGVFYFGSFLWWIWAGIVIATLANAPINFFEKYRIPRLMGVIAVYGFGFAFIVLLFALFIPSLVNEIQEFTVLLPSTFNNLIPQIPLQILEGELFTFDRILAGQDIASVLSDLVGIGLKLFGGFAAFAFIISIALFLSLEKRGIEKFLELVLPSSIREAAQEVWRKGEKRIVGWFGVRIIGAIFIGIATLVGLLILQAPYPFLFSVLAAFADFIPFVGPTLIGIIMVLFAAFDSLVLGGLVAALVFISQQVQSSVFLPLISKKLIGMHPIYVLIIVFIGFKLGGTLGMILSLPFGAVLLEAFRGFESIKNNAKVQ